MLYIQQRFAKILNMLQMIFLYLLYNYDATEINW